MTGAAVIAAIVVATSLITAAGAQNATPPTPPQNSGVSLDEQAEFAMRRHDADGDGRIARREWQGPPQMFARLDADRDGFITRAEMVEHLAASSGRKTVQKATQQIKARSTAAKSRECTPQAVTSPESRWIIAAYAPECTYAGTTLFVDGALTTSPRIVEVDHMGRIVWQYAVRRVGQNIDVAAHYPMDVERLPNGNTLFTLKKRGAYEVDPTGKLVWKYEDHGVSHDADRLSNGNTLVVRGWVAKGEDHVREVAPDGRIVWSWNGLEAYDRPPYANIEFQGWIHVNAATHLPNGNTAISLRNFDMLVEVDGPGKIVREVKFGDAIEKTGRARIYPHDPEIQPDGTVLVAVTAGNAAIHVLTTAKGRNMLLWDKKWPEEDKHMLLIRDVNLLPNGNRLITSLNAITELDPADRVVWRLTIPSIRMPNTNSTTPPDGALFKAQRIGPDRVAYGG